MKMVCNGESPLESATLIFKSVVGMRLEVYYACALWQSYRDSESGGLRLAEYSINRDATKCGRLQCCCPGVKAS